MLRRICKLLGIDSDTMDRQKENGIMLARGDSVPADGTVGYGTGCIFQHTDGGVGTSLYINEGTKTSCDFNAK